ncbi:MAG: Fe-S protein [bacterium (Candidatus Stahlbacteria) CG23_combo_of_CG06-09_8_20_14_all_34_7]|nr:MAG: Fe-S protein [bacterium (Candidatus Stahlbacteria) CG23_combo_of_CG06-09_8_20_14_all_34_7]
MIEEILISVTVLGSLSILLGIAIIITMKFFEIKRDPLVDEIMQVLPGLNCGACGFPGCEQFADAIAKKGEFFTECTVGKDAVSMKVKEILKKHKNEVKND